MDARYVCRCAGNAEQGRSGSDVDNVTRIALGHAWGPNRERGVFRSRNGGATWEQAKVIQLAYFGGFSHSEISGMLGVPLGTVKGRMRLGLEKIRGELAEGLT